VSRVLVTGATGFIGRGALAPLLAAGHDVHAISTREPPVWSPRGVHWHQADLLSPSGPALVVDDIRPEQLLHFAWDAEPGRFWTSTDNLRWVEATLALLRAFADGGGTRAVLAGTCAEYAWSDDTVCVEGVTPLEPATLYGAAKHGLRVVAEAHARQAGYSLAWGRIFFVFGPHEDTRRLGGSVGAALAAGEPAPTSHGEQRRDFLLSGELAEAFVAVLGSPVEGPLNVASGAAIPMRELILALGRASGRPELVQLGARPANPSEPSVLAADVSRLRDEVGWTPTRSLDEAAAETMRWWREQRG
jgi:nucleoside-diphosphate-sugar epimerase